MKVIAALFLAGHGAVHAVMWALPYSEEARADLPMDPSHSWLFGDNRALGLVGAIVVTAAFIVAAVAVVAQAGWWPAAVIVASALSLGLLTVFFSPWWVVGLVIDIVAIVIASRATT